MVLCASVYFAILWNRLEVGCVEVSATRFPEPWQELSPPTSIRGHSYAADHSHVCKFARCSSYCWSHGSGCRQRMADGQTDSPGSRRGAESGCAHQRPGL